MSFKGLVSNLLGVVIPACGETVTYEDTAGNVYTLPAVFDLQYDAVDAETDVVVSSNIPRIGVRLSDLTNPPAKDDIVTISTGEEYRITDSQEDGQGGAFLFMRRIGKLTNA